MDILRAKSDTSNPDKNDNLNFRFGFLPPQIFSKNKHDQFKLSLNCHISWDTQ